MKYPWQKTEPESNQGSRCNYQLTENKEDRGTSLVVQWLRIHLPMQGTWVPSLVWEDPTCGRATKPAC